MTSSLQSGSQIKCPKSGCGKTGSASIVSRHRRDGTEYKALRVYHAGQRLPCYIGQLHSFESFEKQLNGAQKPQTPEDFMVMVKDIRDYVKTMQGKGWCSSIYNQLKARFELYGLWEEELDAPAQVPV